VVVSTLGCWLVICTNPVKKYWDYNGFKISQTEGLFEDPILVHGLEKYIVF